MARPFRFEIRESEAELYHRLHHTTSPQAQERLQMLYWLKTHQVSSRQRLAQLLARNPSTIYRWLHTYHHEGLDALLQVNTPPGKPAIIQGVILEQLRQRLEDPEQGFRSYVEIHEWLRTEFALQVSYHTVYHTVRHVLKAKLKTPRPRHVKAEPEAQDEFEEKLPYILACLIRYLNQGQQIRYFVQDESRFGQRTMAGKKITLKGVKPVGMSDQKRGNFYLYGAVNILSGESLFVEYEKMNQACFQDFIDQLSQQYPESQNFLHMDQAKFHQGKELEWPENVIPIFQPPYSPELNPIERVWQAIKREMKWEIYETLDKVKERVREVLEGLTPERLRSLCGWDYLVNSLNYAFGATS